MSLKTLICASGDLGYTTLKAISSKISIVGVLTDFSSVKIINWANENKLPVLVGNPRKDYFLQKIQSLEMFDVLLSINYLFIIGKDLIELPRLIAINIHGSKLPKYRGRAPHIWAIINGEKSLGITVHQIDEGCDTGDIILQKEIELSCHTTGGEVLKIFEREYPALLSDVLRSLEEGTIKLVKQNHSEATFFGKRQPRDGEISWDWDSKRILNWTRALTAPYPGAFTYLKGVKVLIWSIEESDINIDLFEKDGKVVKVTEDALFVKVPDMVLKITHFTIEKNFKVKVGDIFQGENSL